MCLVLLSLSFTSTVAVWGCPNEPFALAQVFCVKPKSLVSSQLITADMEKKITPGVGEENG